METLVNGSVGNGTCDAVIFTQYMFCVHEIHIGV